MSKQNQIATQKRNADRPYDIIVWGSSGFTGALVAEYLAKHTSPDTVRFAIAGRNKEKLAKVSARIAKVAPNRAGGPIPVIIATIDDAASLDAMVKQARVVISTAGPFFQHGFELVEACVRNRTDYIDSTGEPPFVKKIIDLHHDKATKDGTFIVPSCGFDSIPSDLGTFMLADHFAKKGQKLASVKMSVVELVGGPSGGTIASGLGILTETPYREFWKMLDPYYLCPADTAKGPDSSIPAFFNYNKDVGKWQTYFVMESTNTRYVRRSNALLGNAYGPNFSYAETMASDNFLGAAAKTVGGGIFGAALMLPPVQWLASWAANKYIPAGSGPSDKEIETGHFTCKAVGETVAADGKPAKKAVATVKGIQDPGYGETSKMLAESALVLALTPRAELASSGYGAFKDVKPAGGVVTAATAMGLHLVKRLRAAGMTFEVEDL
ncbi:Saccharopine dehydrogenase-domain-containing protein [Geranomyces variabilis]|nr:Saccharopine dehydrogenase-domain-containing protein [Geranomyces variabilis]KAJ3135243.1 hypothetical protein HDU90_003966 [Geranomyces variabilis]